MVMVNCERGLAFILITFSFTTRHVEFVFGSEVDLSTTVKADSSSSSMESDYDEPYFETDFILTGNNTSLTRFTGFPPGIMKSKLTSVEMNFVVFDPGLLLESLEGCECLETLKLDNVLWNGEFPRSKLQFPRLERFKLNRLYSLEAHTVDQLMSLIFFNKNLTSGRSDHRHHAKRIEVGFTQNQTNTMTTRLLLYVKNITRGLEVNDVDGDVLDHLHGFKFNAILLKSTTLNVNNLPKRLKELHLSNVTTIKGNISSLSEVVHALEKLSISKEVKTDIDLLTVSINTLKSLELNNLTLKRSEFIDTSGNVSFPNLTNLQLTECSLNSGLDLTFPVLEVMEISSVSFEDENATEFFEACEQLTNLTMKGVTVDLSVLPRTLKHLTIVNSSVTHSLDSNFEFEHLKTLQIDDFETVHDEFGIAFKHIRNLTIENNVSASAFLMFLNNFENLMEIMIGFDREPIFQTSEFQEAIQLLKYMEVPDSDNPFTLRKFNGPRSEWCYKSPKWDSKFNYFLYVAYPIMITTICVIGILGNILSARVLFTREMRSSTSCILLGLVFCDTLLLISSIILAPLALHSPNIFGSHEANDHDSIEPELQHLEPIKWLHIFVFYPLSKTAYTGSVYTTIQVTIERYLAVCWPLKSKRVITVKRAIYATLFVLLFSVLFNLPRWFESYELVEKDTEDRIGRFNTPNLLGLESYRKYYHGWAWVTLMYALPTILLASLNFRIWKEIRIATRSRSSLSTSARNYEEAEASITRMLIFVVVIFVICNLICSMISLYYLIWDFETLEKSSFYGTYSIEKTVYEIEILSCPPILINSSVNFFIYCLMGTKFRRQLVQIMPSWIRDCVTPSDDANPIQVSTQSCDSNTYINKGATIGLETETETTMTQL